MNDANTPDSPPPKRKFSPGWIVGLSLLAIVLLNGFGSFGGVLGLPGLYLVVGVGLLFTRHRRLGKIMLISGLVIAILGLGTCALLLSNMHVNGN